MISDANSIFLFISLPSIPFYIILISRMFQNGFRDFQSTFYSAVLGLMIVNLSSICLSIISLSFTEFQFMKSFFWDSRRSYLSVLCYAQLFFFLFASCFSQMIFAFERFANHFLKSTAFFKVIASSFTSIQSMASWISALVVAWHIFIQSDISFVDGQSLHFNVPSTEFNYYMTLYVLSTANVIILVFDIMIITSHMISQQPKTQKLQDFIQIASSTPLMMLLAYLCYHGYHTHITQEIFAIDSLFYVFCGINTSLMAPVLLLDSRIRQCLLKSEES
ncbi:unnamed protein product [Auanema sp. JU1783]|nr:unnamed protein product [Auanema sp. JU1783]